MITKNGPKLLEINARAGLEIQNVNLVPLAKRLEQVEDIKVRSPEKGVAIAKTLFGETHHGATGKKIIHFLDRAIYRGSDIIVRVSPELKKTQISPDLKKKIVEDTILQMASGVQILINATPEIANVKEKNQIFL